MSQRPLEHVYIDLQNLSKSLKNSELDTLIYEIKTLISNEDENKAIKKWKKTKSELAFTDKKNKR